MIEIFKTNVEEDEHAVVLVQNLLNAFPDCKINFDLEDCDKILRVEGESFSFEDITEQLNAHGFQCEVLS